MYLKKLDILGFKSFANKTTVDFSKGITAIVGPNGCGKTNILDALRWVLGEQKISMLRGSKMEEVIFNGTRDVKPLGMAEVTLTLVNNRGILPTEYNEVQITRRLFRSGESEYLLNKVPCRLKDISELFYGTGVGAHSYSVIQQDMIESIISDKAEERRFLFEEAAGITKYKQRKKAAMRKLEATENDFLRLNDIYSEVQTQVRSLKRQYKKAERYQQIAGDIKNWELYLSQTRLNEIELEKRQLKTEFDQLNDQITQKETGIDSVSSQLEADRKEQLDLEQELTRLNNKIYEITDEAHQVEKEISILQEKKSNASSLIERNSDDIISLNDRSEALKLQSEQIKSELETNKSNAEKIEIELKATQAKQVEADKMLLAVRSSRESNNQEMIALESKLSSGKTEDDNLRQQIEELMTTIGNYDEELAKNNLLKDELKIERQTIQAAYDKLTGEKSQLDELVNSTTIKLDQLILENDDLTEEMSRLSASIEAALARKNLLEEMMLHFEGYESGVKAAMDSDIHFDGILGTVADKFVPVDGMEIAVEVALGEMAKFLICDKRSTAEKIIGYLKAEKKGRIGILVPDTGTINPAVKRPEIQSDEFIGWLDNYVKADDNLTSLMHAVLSRTAVCKPGFNADQILERLPYGFNAVSTDGELFSMNTVSGGSDDSFPLFRRKEKVAEQEKMAEEIGEQLTEANDRKNKLTAKIAEVRSDISRLSDEVETKSEELSESQAKVSEADFKLNGMTIEIARLDREKNSQKSKLDAIHNRQYSLGLDYNQLAGEKESLVLKIADSTEKLDEFETAAARASEAVSRQHLALVENRSLIDQTESKINHTLELLNEIDNTVSGKTSEIDTAKIDIESSRLRVLELEEQLKSIFEGRKELNGKQGELRANQNEILLKVTDREKQLKQFRHDKDSVGEKTHQIDIKLNTIESEITSIETRITEEYEEDIHSLTTSQPDETISVDDSRKHLSQMKEQIKRFGAVNLLALEEYKSSSEREVFLKEQLDDLNVAKTDLETTINKINQTARKLFEETFAQVKINFQNLFTELFTGGEADVYLKNPSDPLESDIEIIARPRGKKLLSITMMSGGERALTAISLLFSLYLVKPSPFCILDEIDAPLDDANCRRFLKIIENFSNQTQFIVITHNKLTMEASHNLYGITMEQFGISKIVAVKFNENETDNHETLILERDLLDMNEELNSFSMPIAQISEEDIIRAVELEDEENSNEQEIVTESSEVDEEIVDDTPDSIPQGVDDLPQRVLERMTETVLEHSNTDDEGSDRED